MNRDRIEGNWKQLGGNIRQQWGTWWRDHDQVLMGMRDSLRGRIQERHGIAQEEARKQLSDCQKLMRRDTHAK